MIRYLLFAVLPAACLIFGCKKTASESDSGTTKAVVAVKVMPVVSGTAAVQVHAVGKTDALHEEDVVTPLAGKLVSLKVLDGDAVKSGDVLAVVQPRESQAALQGARALLQAAKTDSERTQAERMVALAESTQTRVMIHAPFDGVVSARAVAEGQVLAENTTLFTLIDLGTLSFMADVPLKELSAITSGQKASVRLEALPERTISATVDAINPQSDAESQSVKVRLRFLSPVEAGERLKVGMSGTADITIGIHSDALLVPKSAILRNDENNEFSVVVVGPDSLSHTIQVALGANSDSLTEVISDRLHAGSNVVIEGQYALADSTQVSAAPERTK